jgi:tetratricopeptide (TPR) repeat protein
MQKVFISHSSLDRDFVEQALLPLLQEAGIEAWYSTEQITGGEAWERSIREGLSGSDSVVLVVSRAAADSKWVSVEMAFALDSKVPLIPIVIDDAKPQDVRMELIELQYLDFREGVELAKARLLKALGAATAENGVKTRARPKPGIWTALSRARLATTAALMAAVAALVVCAILLFRSDDGNGAMDVINVSMPTMQANLLFQTTNVVLQQFGERYPEDAESQAALATAMKEITALVAQGQFERALEQTQGLAATHELPALLNNVGVLSSRLGRDADATQAYAQAIQIDPGFEPARHNAGVWQLHLGDVGAAVEQLAHAPGIAESEALLERTLAQSHLEAEPNDGYEQAGQVPLGRVIECSFSVPTDVDWFTIETPPTRRDWLHIRITNKHPTAQPHVTAMDSAKAERGSGGAPNRGADCLLKLVVDPSTAYYLRVRNGSLFPHPNSPYQMSLELQEAYDEYEPNESVLEAKAVRLGEVCHANIMDAGDKDYYAITMPPGVGQLQARLANTSNTLMPTVTAYAADKSQIGHWIGGTPGQDLGFAVKSTPGSTVYVCVKPHYGAAGSYELTLEPAE